MNLTRRRSWEPHVQPPRWKQLLCRMLNRGHTVKFSTYPRGICIHCDYDPQA